jgi:hypothetical protein
VQGSNTVPVLVEDYVVTARNLLAVQLPTRWRHVVQVAHRTEVLWGEHGTPIELLAAGWLHDIGYSPEIASSGFHPLDGARFLRREGWPTTICDLVAHHSYADIEADRRGVGDELRAEFQSVPGPLRDVLWAADATTGPDGQPMTLDERAAEVGARYGAGHLVSECMLAIKPELAAAIARCEARLAAAETGQPI